MNENHVALKIFGYGSLSALSQKLQLVPTKTAEKGEEYAVGPKKLKRTYEWSYWEYRWSRTEGRFIGDLVEEFVAAVIEPKKTALKEVISTCSAELSIAQYYINWHNMDTHHRGGAGFVNLALWTTFWPRQCGHFTLGTGFDLAKCRKIGRRDERGPALLRVGGCSVRVALAVG